jgi:xanthine dehydrogenase small subunit
MQPPMTSQPIRFYHRSRLVEVSGGSTTRSVLDWLREDARCTGTKEGCNEGDCGACTVVVGELDHEGGATTLQLAPVNACIRFLPSLHGKALFSVEDLKDIAGGALHPVQQAMVDCHGSQCGFCTPGFVMSMWSVYEQQRGRSGPPPGRQAMADALSGNLCRCTGYRPILDAGERMFQLPTVPFDDRPVIAALQGLRGTCTFSHAGNGGTFHSPDDLDALAQLKRARPEARLVAGSTDVALWITKQMRDLPDIIYLGDVAELKRIEQGADGSLWIGAAASLEAAWSVLAARHPSLREVWLRFASPPIRHAGTRGGNVANGSPIGDAAPVLMSLDAALELRLGSRVRRLPLDDFYTGYQTNRLEAGEFVQAIVVPPSPTERQVRAYKISKRFDSDISAVCAALSIELEGDRVKEVRLAFGGMAATVARARLAEAALLGAAWSQASIDSARQALASDFRPLSDMRASASYRMQVAQNLLQRFWLETRRLDPLPATATRVWSTMVDAP